MSADELRVAWAAALSAKNRAWDNYQDAKGAEVKARVDFENAERAEKETWAVYFENAKRAEKERWAQQ